MKRLVFISATLFLIGLSLHVEAQEKVCHIVSDNWQRLQVNFTTGNLMMGEATLDGERFATLSMEGFMPSANIGEPCLPVFSSLIEVPLCDAFMVTVSDAVYDTLEALSLRPIPAQPPRSKSDSTAPKLVIDRGLYFSNKVYGLPTAIVETVGVARDRRLARLQFAPVRYDFATGRVIVCRHATITVDYRNADPAATMKMFERYHSPAFNSKSGVLNSLYPKSVSSAAPVRYLIVAHSMFRNQLNGFIEWKRRKGFLTDIVYTDDPAVGSSTTTIQGYIQSQYTNATADSPAPTYLLLVGDHEQIPAFTGTTDNDHITDLYYTTWTTGDHLPDCYCGRFSAQTESQLAPQINKTMMYEQYTFADPTFLDKAVMVAGVDGGTAGDHGYTHADPAMDYAIINYVNGAHGFSDVRYFKNNTSIVPAGATNVTVASSDGSMSATVRSYYNQGAGFINYSAHGSASSWGTPNFTTTDIASMTNSQKFGLMIGNCCLTNKFQEANCFGEALLRKDNYCGAVGYIGGSNSTYWGEDFYWAVGVRSGISATMSMAYNASHLGVYDRVFHTHGESYSNWATTQGAIMMEGNMAVEGSSSGSKLYYWEIYHLMGDPSVMTYMTQADTMDVSVSTDITFGTTTLPISVTPYAYVALTDTLTHILIAAAYADGSGNAMLTLPSDLMVGTYLLAASAQQYRTAFRFVNVIQPEGPFPIVTDIISAPLNAGDTVALALRVENPGSQTAHGINIQLASSNPMLALSTNTLTLDSLAAGDSVYLTAMVSAYVADDATDNTLVYFNTSTTWTGGIIAANSMLQRWVYAPILSLSFAPANPSLLPGANATVTATLRNSGHAPARINTLSFVSPTSLLSVTHAPLSTSLAPTSDSTVTLTLQANAQLPQNIHVPLAYSFGEISGELPVFIGLGYLENFEGGHTNLPGWNTPASYPWTVSSEEPYEGAYCFRSAQNMGHSQQSDITLNVIAPIADSVSFFYRVSSESNYDKFFFLIDGNEQFNVSGDVNWTRTAFPLTQGNHTLTFRYSKDHSVDRGSDCAWIDHIMLPHQIQPVFFASAEVCVGDTLSIGDSIINTQHASAGCHIAVTSDGAIMLTDYNIYPTYEVLDTIETCDRYLWNGTEYTASGSYSFSSTTAHNCDSIVTLSLTLHPNYRQYDTVNTCDSYTWHGNRYTATGIYNDNLTTIHNCDSTLTLVLTVYPSYRLTDTIETCDSYIWHNDEYTATGFYDDSLATLHGCDSIVGINLTVNHSIKGDTVFISTMATSYEWNGTIYTESGLYQQILHTAHGCDSIVTLVLTIGTNAITQSGIQTICLYPNPTNGMLLFSIPVAEAIVYDVTGRVVARQRDVQSLDLSNMPQGVYTLRLTQQDASTIRRVVKQ